MASIDDKVNAEQKANIAESVVDELGDLVNLGIGAIAPAAGFLLTGNLGVLATSAAYVTGTKGNKDSKTVRDESLSGALFGTFAHYILSPIKYLGSMAKIAYMSTFPFTGQAFYMTEDYIIKNKSHRGFIKNFRQKYMPNVKRAIKAVFPINLMAALFLPQSYIVVATAVASYILRRYVIKDEKKEENIDKTPYPVAISNAIKKLYKNTIGGL